MRLNLMAALNAAATVGQMLSAAVSPSAKRVFKPLKGTGRTPFHVAGRDAVLMDWELPKSRRARRRARGMRS